MMPETPSMNHDIPIMSSDEDYEGYMIPTSLKPYQIEPTPEYRLQQAQIAARETSFLADKVPVAQGQYISKSDYDTLTDQEKTIAQTQGLDVLNKYFQDKYNQEILAQRRASTAPPSTSEITTTSTTTAPSTTTVVTTAPQNSVLLSTGEYISKDDFDNRTFEEQQLLLNRGIQGFNDWVALQNRVAAFSYTQQMKRYSEAQALVAQKTEAPPTLQGADYVTIGHPNQGIDTLTDTSAVSSMVTAPQPSAPSISSPSLLDILGYQYKFYGGGLSQEDYKAIYEKEQAQMANADLLTRIFMPPKVTVLKTEAGYGPLLIGEIEPPGKAGAVATVAEIATVTEPWAPPGWDVPFTVAEPAPYTTPFEYPDQPFSPRPDIIDIPETPPEIVTIEHPDQPFYQPEIPDVPLHEPEIIHGVPEDQPFYVRPDTISAPELPAPSVYTFPFITTTPAPEVPPAPSPIITPSRVSEPSIKPTTSTDILTIVGISPSTKEIIKPGETTISTTKTISETAPEIRTTVSAIPELQQIVGTQQQLSTQVLTQAQIQQQQQVQQQQTQEQRTISSVLQDVTTGGPSEEYPRIKRKKKVISRLPSIQKLPIKKTLFETIVEPGLYSELPEIRYDQKEFLYPGPVGVKTKRVFSKERKITRESILGF